MGSCKVKVCRICFSINCELHLLHENMKLYKGYESLTGLMLADEEDLPPYLCTNCADQLMTCARFRHRSLQAHLTLLDILKNHDHISIESIQAVITMHGDTDFGQIESERVLGDVKIEIKCEDSPIDAIRADICDEVKIECIPDVGADDLLGDDAIGSTYVPETNVMIKEEVFDEASVHVDDSDLKTGEDVSLDDGLLSRREDKFCSVGVRKEEEGAEINQKHTKDVKVSCDISGYENETLFLCHLKAHEENACCNTREYKKKSKRTKTPHTILRNVHSCDACGNSFSSKELLTGHSCSQLCESLSKGSHSCKICNKTFSRKGNLKRHTQLHVGQKYYSCEYCNKKLSQKSHLLRHMFIHRDEKPYSCDVCGSAFSRQDNLKHHMQTHLGNKPYTCDMCKKSFCQKTRLERHILLHTCSKPHECGVCRKRFRLKYHLRVHMVVHSGDKPYSCEVCDKSFSRKLTLNNHVLTHSGDKPYSCDVCDMSFRQKGHLKRHKLVHVVDKQYLCGVCEKSFSRKDHLDEHMQTHSRDKLYTCDYCGKSFWARGTLLRHIRRHSAHRP